MSCSRIVTKSALLTPALLLGLSSQAAFAQRDAGQTWQLGQAQTAPPQSPPTSQGGGTTGGAMGSMRHGEGPGHTMPMQPQGGGMQGGAMGGMRHGDSPGQGMPMQPQGGGTQGGAAGGTQQK